jgi:hypothetical protein
VADEGGHMIKQFTLSPPGALGAVGQMLKTNYPHIDVTVVDLHQVIANAKKCGADDGMTSLSYIEGTYYSFYIHIYF